jgi:hypothetical protein
MSTLSRIKALFDDDFAFLCVLVCARVRVHARWITPVRLIERSTRGRAVP